MDYSNQTGQSPLFKLYWRDFFNGLVTAVLGAILVTLQAKVSEPNFSIFDLNWQQLEIIANVGVIAGVSYLASKFLRDENGKTLGKI